MAELEISVSLLVFLIYFGCNLLILFGVCLYYFYTSNKRGCELILFIYQSNAIYGAVVVQAYDTGFIYLFFFFGTSFLCSFLYFAVLYVYQRYRNFATKKNTRVVFCSWITAARYSFRNPFGLSPRPLLRFFCFLTPNIWVFFIFFFFVAYFQICCWFFDGWLVVLFFCLQTKKNCTKKNKQWKVFDKHFLFNFVWIECQQTKNQNSPQKNSAEQTKQSPKVWSLKQKIKKQHTTNTHNTIQNVWFKKQQIWQF